MSAVSRPTSQDRAATLHDVANRVGVSPRTVSRVVNDQGGFSDATKDRVLQAVAELQYRPNAMARGLITRRSDTLAFLAPSLVDPFFPEVAEGVQRAADGAGLTMLFATSNNDVDSELEVLSRLEAHAPHGVILFPSRRAVAHLGAHLDRGLRMVLLDSEIDHPNAVCVVSDLRAGAHIAVRHLLERPRRRLAMVSNVHSGTVLGRRQIGFTEALPLGMESIVEAVDPTIAGGRLAAAALLERHPDIDGVFAYNDAVAIGVIQALQEAGRVVPDDVAVIGCDDIEMGSVITPSLTTIRIDGERLGSEAVRALIGLVNGESNGSPQVLPVELVVRDSC